MAITADEFNYVRTLLRDQAAIIIEPGKEYLVENRLTPLAQKMGLPGVSHLIARLRSEPVNGAHHKAVEALTIGETLFFRDLHPFETLRKQLIPELMQKRQSVRSLRIWCGACSTGQEPYSVALTIREYFPQLKDWQVRILATDINTESLERARTGTYTQLEVNRGMPAMLLVKHFKKLPNQNWQINPEIRAMVEFQELNLARPLPPLPLFDLIFLRNVLIYFDTATKRNILQGVRSRLAPDGYFFLGSSETTLYVDEAFETVNLGKTVAYRKKQ